LLPLPNALEEVFEGRYATGVNQHQSLLGKLAQVSQKLHTCSGGRERRQLEDKLNEMVATIYKLDESDVKALENYYHFADGTRQLELALGN
jgi:predicted metalloprotease with PDZ domain